MPKQNSDVKDITVVFDHYRQSARAIWNTAFWPDPDFRNWDSIGRFHKIERLLFYELVVAKLDIEWQLQGVFANPIPFFHIVPTIEHGTPIMIQNPRPGASTGYWDHPVKSVKPSEAELLFVSYFDWNRMDYIDLRYYLVKITRLDAHADLVGRDALIERQHAVVHLVNDSDTSAESIVNS